MLPGVTKWSPISGKLLFWGKMGLASTLLEMNYKISVYHVEWRVASTDFWHLLYMVVGREIAPNTGANGVSGS